ncbi:divalent-cation tolerance protein CutA [Niveibacterium umoris]|uniref:Periplasmic divalent cation tolerance protein n=1 Tax=Niveibacterium umoris TaxID=1193620 RepID=A0A840BKQ2_9RHOO|nr:divalent-cation tolerance protein CutA [Niveibacterium umoris]MBB4013835.1 periplasmic divalent cation tolerance protein [Niveibacterium umoris]
MPEPVLIVLCNLPDADSAASVARMLVERRLAACVNILAPARSVYRWKNEIEQAEEIPLLIKTTATRYAALEVALIEAHPYEVPEILAFEARSGAPAYLQWVVECTVPDDQLPDGL